MSVSKYWSSPASTCAFANLLPEVRTFVRCAPWVHRNLYTIHEKHGNNFLFVNSGLGRPNNVSDRFGYKRIPINFTKHLEFSVLMISLNFHVRDSIPDFSNFVELRARSCFHGWCLYKYIQEFIIRFGLLFWNMFDNRKYVHVELKFLKSHTSSGWCSLLRFVSSGK